MKYTSTVLSFWIKGLKKSSKTKEFLYRKFVKNPSQKNERDYKIYRNNLNHLIFYNLVQFFDSDSLYIFCIELLLFLMIFFNPLDIPRLFDLLDLYFFIGKTLSYSTKKSLKKAVYDSVGSFLNRVDCQSQFSISQQKASGDFLVIILVVQSSILGVLGQFCNSCSVMVKIGK